MGYEMYYSDYPLMFSIAAFVMGLLVMYLFRLQAQRLLEQIFRMLQKQFRLLSRVCIKSEQRVRLRHYEVTKALVEELVQRRVERCYGQIEKMVKKELAYYQAQAVTVRDQLDTLQKDYEGSAQIPPPSPEWVAAVEAIAQIESDERNSEVMLKILADMHDTIQLHQQDAMREHRWNVTSRHKVLAGLEPQWKKLGSMVSSAERKNDQLQHKLRRLDQEMRRYELLTAGNGQGFMASVLARFTLTALLMSVAVITGFYNAQLLLVPFEQRLPAGMALAVPVLVMHSMMLVMAAVLLCESVRITHMLPFLSAVPPLVKRVMALISGGLILALSVMSACWAGSLFSLEAVVAADLTQWLLALTSFAACWVFAMVVIPLEYCLQTLRPVLSSLLQLILHTASVVFRVLASLSYELGRLTMRLYDAIIFIPLRVETALGERRKNKDKSDAQSLDVLGPATMTFNEEEVDCGNVTQIDFSVNHKKSEM